LHVQSVTIKVNLKHTGTLHLWGKYIFTAHNFS